MSHRVLVLITRLALAVMAVVWAVGLCLAQASSSEKPKGPAVPEGCLPGQMRCINNEHRKAAAQRNAERRAKAVQNAPASQGEVKK